MAIISENDTVPVHRYRTTQLMYAMTYVAVTFVVLIILNVYCFHTCQQLFYKSKEASMIEKCQLASDEIAALDVLSSSAVTGIVEQMGSLKVSRLVVTDKRGTRLYDSDPRPTYTYALLPEILQAIAGNDVFTWQYHDGSMRSRAATPIVSRGTIVGCVYMTEYDTEQGALIDMLQSTILHITLILETILVIFSVIYSRRFSRRIGKIMTSMRIIQKGDYSHKVAVGGRDELTVLGNEFNALSARLQNSEEKRSRFVSDASHELKTPLASIKLLTDSILQNDMDAETMREFVEDIGNEANRLNRMTAKLLALTRVDGQAVEESELIRMAPTVKRVHNMLSPMAKKAGVTIQLDLSNDSTVLVLEDDLYQIVFNLMENGIKYNRSGGTLTVKLQQQEETAILSVADTGMGIPEEALSHVFERFYRVDKARARATGGSGLGLAIVRSIVARNRGEITVQSQLGQGTEFTVTFPVFDTEVDAE